MHIKEGAGLQTRALTERINIGKMSPPNLLQTQTQPNSESEIPTPQLAEEKKKKKTLPIAILIVRVMTMICLLVSLIIIVSNTATIRGVYQVVTIHFNNLNTYR